jgi:DNA-binding MarR family transcriptional regulator
VTYNGRQAPAPAMSIEDRVHQTRFRSPRERAFVSLLYVASNLMQRLEEACQRHGLTHTQYNVLRILRGAHPAGHARCDIMDRLITRAPDVTRLLDRLEQQGWIARSWSRENRRLSIATITDEGLALLKRADAEMRVVEQQATASLSREELDQMSEICGRIADSLD